MLGETEAVVPTMASGHHLEPNPSELPKLPEEQQQAGTAEPVAGGMGNDRDATGPTDPANRGLQACPFTWDVSGLSVDEEMLEHAPFVRDEPPLHQVAGEVGPADQTTLRQGLGPGVGTLDTRLGETPTDLLRPPMPELQQPVEPALQSRAAWVDPQPDHMNGSGGPGDGDLDPGDQAQAAPRGRDLGLRQAVRGVVIREGKHLDPSPGGMVDQGRGTQDPVRGGGMGMEVGGLVHGVDSTRMGPWIRQDGPGMDCYHRNMLPPVDICYLAQEVARLGDEVKRLAEESEQPLEPHPEVLVDGLVDLLDSLSAAESADAWPSGSSLRASSVGEPDNLLTHGLDLLAGLANQVGRLQQPQLTHAIEALALPLACWLIRRGAELIRPELVVNAAASLANRLKNPEDLATLYGLMTEVVDGISPRRSQELEGGGRALPPDRPWRVLLLNRAIVATRSHRPGLMVDAFQAVCEHLPEDAPSFFREGMGQMEALNYPQQVRDVMDRYYQLWCAGQRLH